MALPVSPTTIVNNPANNYRPTVMVFPIDSTAQLRIPIVSPSATIIGAVPRVLTPQHARSPFVHLSAEDNPSKEGGTHASSLLDQTLQVLSPQKEDDDQKQMIDAGTDTKKNDTSGKDTQGMHLHDNDEEGEHDEIQDALDVSAASSAASMRSTVVHHVHHTRESSSSSSPTFPVLPHKSANSVKPRTVLQPNAPLETRIRTYLTETCYPTQSSTLNELGLEHFCKQIIVSTEDQLSKKDCSRFCGFMDKTGHGKIALKTMVKFIQQGLSLDDHKRSLYVQKSDMHCKLMVLVLEIWNLIRK